MWFASWASIARVLVLGTLGYLALIVLLRGSGKRTLSKMNAFDFVVTITLGSTFAALLLNKSVTLADGVAALALLIGLQFVVTSISVRSKRFRTLVKGTPQVVFLRGEYLEAAMKRERVASDEVRAALREHGVTDVSRAAVILETNGALSVVEHVEDLGCEPFEEVRVPDEAPHVPPG